MKAMIFAAGLGTRLRPFTLDQPKALVPLHGVPMLERVIRKIAGAGITDITVNVHHFAPLIEEFLIRNDNFGLNISVSRETERLLDTGGGLLAAGPLLEKSGGKEPILLHNADIFTDFPLEEMMEAHNRSGADVTLLCAKRVSSRTLYFQENRLTGWQNLKTGETRPEGFEASPLMDSTPFGGVHIVNPSVFPLLEEYSGRSGEPFSIIPFYLANLGRLYIRRFMLPDSYRWFDVGSSEKLAAAEATFQ